MKSFVKIKSEFFNFNRSINFEIKRVDLLIYHSNKNKRFTIYLSL